MLLHRDQWTLTQGVIDCMLIALSGLALLGLRYPLQMLPILLFESAWKLLWLGVVALPMWLTGQLTAPYAAMTADLLWVVIILAVIPWRYVAARYLTQPGDRWRPRTRPPRRRHRRRRAMTVTTPSLDDAVALAARAETRRHPGLVIGACNTRTGQRTIVGVGHTRLPDGPAPQADTLFEIGSITKVFTGLLLAIGVVRGEVTLDTPIELAAAARAGPSAPGRPTDHSGAPRHPPVRAAPLPGQPVVRDPSGHPPRGEPVPRAGRATASSTSSPAPDCAECRAPDPSPTPTSAPACSDSDWSPQPAPTATATSSGPASAPRSG